MANPLVQEISAAIIESLDFPQPVTKGNLITIFLSRRNNTLQNPQVVTDSVGTLYTQVAIDTEPVISVFTGLAAASGANTVFVDWTTAAHDPSIPMIMAAEWSWSTTTIDAQGFITNPTVSGPPAVTINLSRADDLVLNCLYISSSPGGLITYSLPVESFCIDPLEGLGSPPCDMGVSQGYSVAFPGYAPPPIGSYGSTMQNSFVGFPWGNSPVVGTAIITIAFLGGSGPPPPPTPTFSSTVGIDAKQIAPVFLPDPRKC